MVFRSYTYDASEVDLQYFLDDDGKEIQEIVIDENAFTGWCLQDLTHNLQSRLCESYDSYSHIGCFSDTNIA